MPRIGQCFIAMAMFAGLAPVGSDAVGAADAIDHRKEYAACMALVYRQPDKALESAKAWENKGGGASAGHCAALALFEQGRYGEAAERLEALAAALPQGSRVAPAELLAQAANIWHLTGDLERAKRDIAAAVKMAPENAGLLVDQARIFAEEEAYPEALEALERALALNPGDGDAHAFRAAALRRLGRLDEAAQAIAEALRLNPENPSAWLESGLIRLDQGDAAGAKLDWQQTKQRFDGTPAAEAAAARLDALKEMTN